MSRYDYIHEPSPETTVLPFGEQPSIGVFPQHCLRDADYGVFIAVACADGGIPQLARPFIGMFERVHAPGDTSEADIQFVGLVNGSGFGPENLRPVHVDHHTWLNPHDVHAFVYAMKYGSGWLYWCELVYYDNPNESYTLAWTVAP